MLFGSNRRTAPRPEASSAAFARSSRSWRSRGKSTRCSQSTARVASGEPTVLVGLVTALPPDLRVRETRRAPQVLEEDDEVVVRIARFDRSPKMRFHLSGQWQLDACLVRGVECEIDVLL